jgi:hypothetical protein
MHAPCAPAAAQLGRAHLELFGNGYAIVIPARVGMRTSSCRAHAWTSDPTGVVRFDRASTLGELFAIWGEPLGPRRLLSFHGVVSLFRNGVRLRGDPRTFVLRDGDEVVLEVGPFVTPHPSYRFPPR